MKLNQIFESADNYLTLVNALKRNCMNNLANICAGRVQPLYRGIETTQYEQDGKGYRFLITAERTTRRTSTYDDGYSNIFLTYVSNHSAWKEVPAREYSSFLTSNYNRATLYFGPPWIVIPYDSVAEFAALNSDFNYKLPDLSSINYIQKHIGRILENVDENDYDEDFKKIISQKELMMSTDNINSLDQIKRLSTSLEQLFDFFEEHSTFSVADKDETMSAAMNTALKRSLTMLENEIGKNLWDWLEENLTPEHMGVKVLKFDQLGSLPDVRLEEVWFKGPYIAFTANDPKDRKYMLESDWFMQLCEDVLG